MKTIMLLEEQDAFCHRGFEGKALRILPFRLLCWFYALKRLKSRNV